MNGPGLQRFFPVILLLCILLLPRTATAVDLIVEHNPTDPAHFSTIQAAIDYAGARLAVLPANSTTYRVLVKADSALPYSGAFTPISNVPIIGSETAATILSGSASVPLISINGVSNVTIRNFTIVAGSIGIAVTNSSLVAITNNILRVASSNTAIQVRNSPATSIVNNTFYQNGTALNTDSDARITNNIFSGNGTAIAAPTTLTQLTYNTYHNNTSNGAITPDVRSLPNNSVTNSDPLFVDTNVNDFHLRSGSPCHTYSGGNAGNPGYPNGDNPAFADMGVYGGPDSDTVPFKVTGFTATSGEAANAITLNWNLNRSYQVNGYHVYYGTASGDRSGTGAAEGDSPLTISQGGASAILSNIPLLPTATPAAVTGVTLSPANQSLVVSWSPAANATRYKVYYSTVAFTPASLPATFLLVNGAAPTGISLDGLTNGITCYVAVAALSQSRYFLTVTALNNSGGTPGVSNESGFAAESIGYLGPYQESAISNVVPAVPALQSIGTGWFGGGGGGGGCFIATAAYGCYSAPQVQLLRDFRDRFLLTNSPGRAFVAWYYRYGPCCAAFINAHPWCKPLVRLMLLPLIGGAMFLLHTTITAKYIVMAALLLIGGEIVRRNRSAWH